MEGKTMETKQQQTGTSEQEQAKRNDPTSMGAELASADLQGALIQALGEARATRAAAEEAARKAQAQEARVAVLERALQAAGEQVPELEVNVDGAAVEELMLAAFAGKLDAKAT